MTKPELSIIIPAYNCGKAINRMVESITNQNYQDYELIIVNDHSTDNTSQVLKNLASKNSKITIINKRKNGGASAARNTGINKAGGKYLMFLDADDDIRPGTLSSFIQTVKRTGAELVVSGFTVVTTRGQKELTTVNVCTNQLPTQQPDESWRLYILRLLGLDGRLYQVWNKLYLTSVIRDNHLRFQTGINFGEDLLFNLDYYAHMTGQINFMPTTPYIYCQDLDGGTFSKSSLIYQNRLQNYQALLRFMSPEPDSTAKESLLRWIKYNWIYSHLLAINLSNLTRQQKIASIQEVARIDGQLPLSSPSIIGRKRFLIEKILHSVIHHPRLATLFIQLSQYLKHNRLTANLWQTTRQLVNK